MVALSLASRFVGLIRTGGFSTQIRRPSASVGTLAAFVAVPLAAGQVMYLERLSKGRIIQIIFQPPPPATFFLKQRLLISYPG